MIPPAAPWCSTASCAVGVGTMPQSITSAPTARSAASAAAARAGPDVRESRASTTARRSADATKDPNAAAYRCTTSGVRSRPTIPRTPDTPAIKVWLMGHKVTRTGPRRVSRPAPVPAPRPRTLASTPYGAPMTQTTSDDLRPKLATRAVHAGQAPDPTTGAIMTPIYQTSTYVQAGIGDHKGFEYARTRNPTRDALERNVAALEGGRHGFAFASGMAATDAILSLLANGDHVICGENVYGGTHRLMTQVSEQRGLGFTFVDTRSVESVGRAIASATKLAFIETPTNPMMRLADLAGIGELCRARGLLFVVDNTFATPVFQQPLEHGADLVLHSTTKYLNGHSDMVGGVVVTSRDDLAERLAFLQNAAGAVPGPMDCWLALRGTKTLPLRMAQHDASGRALAAWLASHPVVRQVYYPGLPSHEQHDLALRQMRGFGGMISVELGSLQRAQAMVRATKIFQFAESLGGVESLIAHPATMTHASVPVTLRESMGLSLGLVRLSVGIEDLEDLRADLDQALEAAGKVAV